MKIITPNQKYRKYKTENANKNRAIKRLSILRDLADEISPHFTKMRKLLKYAKGRVK